jgi:hypothetical protein
MLNTKKWRASNAMTELPKDKKVIESIVGKMIDMDIKNLSDQELERVFKNCVGSEKCKIIAKLLITSGLKLENGKITLS